ncbi:MAG: hypothetical protein H7145_22540 [Akkermansiaceae bacterium]|nr:hypothetical protein [Armatimonadota bacterium]
MKSFSFFERRSIFVLLVAVLSLLPVAILARGTSEERAIVVGETAFLLGTPRMVVPATVVMHSVSPTGRYLLAFHMTPEITEPFSGMRESFALPTKHFLSISLFDARTGRTRALKTWNDNETVFRFPDEITWLADDDTAVVSFSATHLPTSGGTVPPPPKPDTTYPIDADLLVVHCARQTVQTVALLTAQTSRPVLSVTASPTRAEALISYWDTNASNTQALRLLTANGILGTALTDQGGTYGVYGWGQDGNELLLTRSVQTGDATKPYTHTFWLWERRTKTMRELPERPRERTFGGNTPKYKGIALPIRFVTEAGSLGTERGAKRSASFVVAEGEDGKERVVVAADAEAVAVTGKRENPTLIYEQNNALVVVPVRNVTQSAYLAYLQKQVEEHARQIGTGMRMYAADYDEQYPLPQNNVSDAISPYLADSKKATRDPRTGENAFTYTYTGIPDASGRTALFTLKTVAGTYRVLVDGDGKTVTERDPPKP